jgi:nitrite reductase/ring-hydroxylating ferredoxin subunit
MVHLLLLSADYTQTMHTAHALSLVMMGRRSKGRGSDFLKRTLNEGNGSSSTSVNPRSLNRGRGQEIVGVTMPAEGSLRGWEFGSDVRMVAAKVGGRYYALQGECPRCGFDLWKGDLISTDAAGFDDLPRVACPTCATTYSMRNGKAGPPLKRGGLAGFVGNLAKSATALEAGNGAKVFVITRDEDDGRVYCRER